MMNQQDPFPLQIWKCSEEVAEHCSLVCPTLPHRQPRTPGVSHSV